MKKSVLLFCKADIFDLPPLITIIDSLKDTYSIKLVSQMWEGDAEKFIEMYKHYDVELITSHPLSQSHSKVERIKNRLKRVQFRIHMRKLFPSLQYDVLWVIHEDTFYDFPGLFKGKKYLASLYELNDNRMYINNKIAEHCRNAFILFEPEYNRACIARSWMKLSKTPSVIPNKPLGHPLKRNLPCVHKEYFENKFTILYQGLVIEERKIDAYCEAVAEMPDVQLIVLGNGYGAEEYRNSLKQRFSYVKFIDFVRPPAHLNVTSNAQIGIVTYDYSTLNTIFCAPNKVWETAGFGIPMIANDIPGLADTVGKFHAGLCVDTEDAQAIKNAIVEIKTNYQHYSQGALDLYQSVDVKLLINNAVEAYLK